MRLRRAQTTGLYRVAFYGAAGPTGNADGSPDSALDPTGGFRADAGSSVNAWDVSVRAAGDVSTATDIPGRVFTYVLAAFTAGNPRPVSLSMYLNTLDGYRYLVNTNGFDPNGFVFYGNREGFLDADGVTPLNHDVVGNGASAQQLPALDGGVHLAKPQYPLSFEPLAAETLAALGIPGTPVPPVLHAVDYAGRATARGSYVDDGGTFTLNASTGGTYEIVISRDGTNYDPGLPANGVLRGVIGAGVSTVTWDGRDNAGVPFPVQTNYQVKATLRGGEYHAPMLDVESSTRGGPSITLLNPPGDVCPFSGVPSTGTNCTRVFYDDRSYTSSNGTVVGDAATGKLCATFTGALPAALFADPATGVDSTSTARAFGDGLGANANTHCPATGGTLGDAKGLDVWTYFPSAGFATTLDVLPIPAAPVAVDDAGTTTVDTALVVPAAGILGNDTGTRLSVLTTVTTPPTHGTVVLGTDGSYTYTPSAGYTGTDSFVYTITDDAGQTASATVRLTVTPRAVDDGWTTPVNTTLVVAPRGVLVNDVGTALVASILTPPTHGTVTLRTDGGLTYVPDHDFSGTDTFTYRASDGTSSAPATVTILVTPERDRRRRGHHPAQRRARRRGPGVLVNDSGTALTVTSVGTPAHGTVVMDPDGGYRYTPPAGWGGTDTFTYSAVDGSGQPVSAVVTVRVTPPVQLAAATDDAKDGVPGPASPAHRAHQRRARRQPVVRHDHRPADRSGHRPARRQRDGRRRGDLAGHVVGQCQVQPGGRVRRGRPPALQRVEHRRSERDGAAHGHVPGGIRPGRPEPRLAAGRRGADDGACRRPDIAGRCAARQRPCPGVDRLRPHGRVGPGVPAAQPRCRLPRRAAASAGPSLSSCSGAQRTQAADGLLEDVVALDEGEPHPRAGRLVDDRTGVRERAHRDTDHAGEPRQVAAQLGSVRVTQRSGVGEHEVRALRAHHARSPRRSARSTTGPGDATTSRPGRRPTRPRRGRAARTRSPAGRVRPRRT